MYGPTEAGGWDAWAEMRDGWGLADALGPGYLRTPRPVPTGIAPWDALAGGLRPGLTVLGGEPGAGKSALALQACVLAAFSGMRALYVSLEMDVRQCAMRACSFLSAELSGEGLAPFAWSADAELAERTRNALGLAGVYGESDWAAAERLARGADPVLTAARVLSERCPGFAVCADPEARGAGWLAGVVGRAASLGASLAVVDYLQLVDAGVPGASEYDRVGAASRELLACANGCGIPVLALSSLSREGAKAPGMHGYRGSGQIEFDANMCAVLVRGRDDGVAELHVSKNRHGMTTGEGAPIALEFDGAHNRFTW